MNTTRLIRCWLLALALLAACSGGYAASAPTPTAFQPEPTLTSEPVSTPTAAPLPTASTTLAPSPTPTLFPMSIEAMHQREYPGSEITIEEELTPGSNYQRYYASYLSEGLRIYALLTIPNGDSPEGGWPGIVFNHGYIPPDEYRTTERYVAYVDGLASNDYIVFRIDYRGHDRSEGSPSGAYSDPGYTVDVLNALASLRAFPQVNPERIGMWGHSMGGYLTLRAMVISPDVRAGVIWGGVVASYPDMIALWRRDSGGQTPTPPAVVRGWRSRWAAVYGSPAENPEFWASISANSYLKQISGPLQLHHSDTDETVPVVFSELLSAEMQAVGQPVELYIYPGDNHNIANYFNQAMQRTVAFFDRYLK